MRSFLVLVIDRLTDLVAGLISAKIEAYVLIENAELQAKVADQLDQLQAAGHAEAADNLRRQAASLLARSTVPLLTAPTTDVQAESSPASAEIPKKRGRASKGITNSAANGAATPTTRPDDGREHPETHGHSLFTAGPEQGTTT